MNTALTKTESIKAAKDTQFAQHAAVILKDIVNQNHWAIKLGAGEHLKYEAWQTIGKYYGYTVKTHDANFVEYGAVKGFEAKATVIDNKTGFEIGGAEAVCLNDESNWKTKPLFQLKSMAQTRAGSKALRQILGFVVALAGYNPTPAEEMTEPAHTYISPKYPDIRERSVEEFPAKPTETDTEPWLASDDIYKAKEEKESGEIREKIAQDSGCTCFAGDNGKFHRKDCPLWVAPS